MNIDFHFDPNSQIPIQFNTRYPSIRCQHTSLLYSIGEGLTPEEQVLPIPISLPIVTIRVGSKTIDSHALKRGKKLMNNSEKVS